MAKITNTLPLDAYQRLLAQQEKNAHRARPRHLEGDLQRECVKWFRGLYPTDALMLFAVPNGGGRSRIEAGIMKAEGVTAYLMQEGMAQAEKIALSLGQLTDDERQTILDGCLINFYRGQA